MTLAHELQQRAVAALESGRLEEAERSYRELLAVYPHPGVLHNLGLVLVRLRRDAEAVVLFEQSLAKRPGDSNVLLSLSNALLHCNRSLEALACCEDAICTRVDLQLQPALVPLLARHWPARHIDALGARPSADVDRRIALLSLPLALQIQDIGAADSYLQADPACVERWGCQLAPRRGGRIGIAWRGNAAKRHDPHRSLPVEALQGWLEAAAAKNCSVVALQRDANAQEREWLAQFPHVEVPGEHLDDFEDTAAVMELTDQVVSVDTSVIHLAGALGRPAIVLLKFSSDWRWGIDRPDGATYRCIRALRQPAAGQWRPVVRALIDALP